MKKIILSLLLALPSLFLNAQNRPVYCGDANADGEVNNADIITIQNYILTGQELKVIDYDQPTSFPSSGTIRIQLSDNKMLLIPAADILGMTTMEPASETEHESVDLGLPSKTLWATCNIGATSATDAGTYFNSSNGTTDIAKAQWQDKWVTPNATAFKELIDNCIWTWSAEKSGYDVKSKTNENSIFLPAAGHQEGMLISEFGVNGYYWTDELYGSNEDCSCLAFSSQSTIQPNKNKQLSFLIRPIIKPQDPGSTPSGEIDGMEWDE